MAIGEHGAASQNQRVAVLLRDARGQLGLHLLALGTEPRGCEPLWSISREGLRTGIGTCVPGLSRLR